MMKNNYKVAVTVVTALLLVGLYIIIFSFSDQNGQESGRLSIRISEECVEILQQVSGKEWTAVFRRELSEYLEHPIRKMAHFSEYACMGILVYILWRQWMVRNRRLYVLVTSWVFLSAVGDEIHQLFVPERWGSVADVLLDTCGGLFGILLCVFIEHMHNKINVRRCKNVGDNAY